MNVSVEEEGFGDARETLEELGGICRLRRKILWHMARRRQERLGCPFSSRADYGVLMNDCEEVPHPPNHGSCLRACWSSMAIQARNRRASQTTIRFPGCLSPRNQQTRHRNH